MLSLLLADDRGHLPRASTVIPVLPHEMIAARVSDPTSYVLPRLEDGWVDHGTHCCWGPLACQQVHFYWVPPPPGRLLHAQDEREIVPTILIRDATDNEIVVNVA